jgi:hypothetical protein
VSTQGHRMAAWVAGMVLLAGSAQAGRPLGTDDAYPVEPGDIEIEVGADYHDGEDMHHVDFPASLTFGLLDRLEVGVGFGGQLENRKEVVGRDTVTGIGDLEIGLKAHVLDADVALVDQAIALAVKFPTANEDKGLGSGELDYDLTWIASRSITDRLNAHVNLGYTWFGDTRSEDFSDVIHGGVAAGYLLTETLEGVAEILFECPVENGGGESAAGVNIGLRWMANEALTIDLAIGTGFTDEWPDLTAGVGMTWLIAGR